VLSSGPKAGAPVPALGWHLDQSIRARGRGS
jgi:hypothetical protein